MKKSPQYPPPLIRELASPASSYLHLKAVVGPNEHDHNKPTLCGLEDHGSWAYAVPKTMSEVERLRQEKGGRVSAVPALRCSVQRRVSQTSLQRPTTALKCFCAVKAVKDTQ